VLTLSGSRMLFAMAESGDLPKPLASIHARFRTPAYAVALTTGVVWILTLSGTFVYLLTISILSRLVTYLCTCSALIVLRRRSNAPPSSFRLPGGPVIAAAGIAIIIWLLSNSTLREARDTSIAAAAGLMLYWLSHRRRSQS